MSRPYAVILHITEKNCSKEQLDKLISLLKEENRFSFLGSSFSSDKTHNGTTLYKSLSGENAQIVFEGVKAEIESMEINMMGNFNCQLTVAATDVVSDVIFIK